VDTADVAATS